MYDFYNFKSRSTKIIQYKVYLTNFQCLVSVGVSNYISMISFAVLNNHYKLKKFTGQTGQDKKKITGRTGRGKNHHGSSGSLTFFTGRVGSGQVQNFAGRVGSGQGGFKKATGRVGSGQNSLFSNGSRVAGRPGSGNFQKI